MIGFISGKMQVFGERVLLTTAGGVGYFVFVSEKLLAAGNQDYLELYIYSYIRQDRFELYGFATPEQLQLFELLVAVSGCGPKTALLLASGGVTALKQAVQQAEVAYFTAFPRVGKKLAQKLIIELKSKLGGLKDLDLTPQSSSYTDALEALLTLGFSESQIHLALQQLDPKNVSSGELIKQALKLLHPA